MIAAKYGARISIKALAPRKTQVSRRSSSISGGIKKMPVVHVRECSVASLRIRDTAETGACDFRLLRHKCKTLDLAANLSGLP